MRKKENPQGAPVLMLSSTISPTEFIYIPVASIRCIYSETNIHQQRIFRLRIDASKEILVNKKEDVEMLEKFIADSNLVTRESVNQK